MILRATCGPADTASVINRGEDGASGNLAPTYGFLARLPMNAVGAGAGIGIDAPLSARLVARRRERALPAEEEEPGPLFFTRKI